MQKLLLTIAALSLFTTTSIAQTAVSGQIRTNTTWTKAGSPYNCTGLIEVDTHATLTIEPGAIVNLDLHLVVYGSIIFQHNTTDTTVIQSNNTNGQGSEIRFLSKTYADTITIMNYKFIASGININGPQSTVIIQNSRFTNSNTGWHPSSSPSLIFEQNICSNSHIHIANANTSEVESILINNNVFENFDGQCINGGIGNKKEIEISNNIFTKGHTGIRINHTGMLIKNNTFSQMKNYGILLWGSSKPIRIHSNTFFDNDYAIGLTNSGDIHEIKDNAIYNNNVGIAFGHTYNTSGIHYIIPPTITGNCIYNNKICGLSWAADNNITIGANWWGTTDTTKVDSMIIDDKDDFKRGFVTYNPVMLQKNPNCNYIPPASVTKVKADNTISVYPNPYSNSINFNLGSSKAKYITLFNIVGKEVARLDNVAGKVQLNTKHHPSGIYIYKVIYDSDNISVGKILKK